MNFLSKIFEIKKEEVSRLKKGNSVNNYMNSGKMQRKVNSLSDSLKNPERTGIIAEFKRKSPSKGILNWKSDIPEVAAGYEKARAAALSVLTENKYFGGSEDDLIRARLFTALPILKKDFIIDEIQIYQAKYHGADAILLIAALVGEKRVYELAQTARKTGLEVILEIHSKDELGMINEYVNIIGVNNRNLDSMEVDINTSVMLADKIPPGFVKISESGISSPGKVIMLREAGYDGFLIGEKFMSQPDPVKAFMDFVMAIKTKS